MRCCVGRFFMLPQAADWIVALSVTCGDNSPKGRAKRETSSVCGFPAATFPKRGRLFSPGECRIEKPLLPGGRSGGFVLKNKKAGLTFEPSCDKLTFHTAAISAFGKLPFYANQYSTHRGALQEGSSKNFPQCRVCRGKSGRNILP